MAKDESETSDDAETAERREMILKQLLNLKPQSQKTVAKKAKRRRQSKQRFRLAPIW